MDPAPTSTARQRWRRLGGIGMLLVGGMLASRILKPSWPRDHALIFRLPREAIGAANRLDVSLTPVGEREPSRGLSLALGPQGGTRDVRHVMNLPDGDYIVTLALTYGAMTGPSAPTKSETSRARRVTLSEGETLVVFEAEGSE